MGSDDFPFGIIDVVELLQLRVRRRLPDNVYTDCPICGDRRGKMNVNFAKNIWRCNYCGEYGGMLALYAKVYGTSTSDAYREICDALQVGDYGSGFSPIQYREYQGTPPEKPEGIPQSPRASRQQVHQTYSVLLKMLTLLPIHKEHLMSEKRGLSEQQIRQYGFKSVPPMFLCKKITENLIAKGCTVEGVPGFYQDKNGNWTVNFTKRLSGILLPVVGFDGLIQGMDKQLSVLADMCDELPVIVRFQRDQQSVTVTIPPPWDAAAEIKALEIQDTIQEWSRQYPNVVCYCFDSFSTLLYVL